jgi:hypothetical protein
MSVREGLPELDGDVDVDAAELTRFARNGFACVRGLATPAEVAAFRPHIVEAALAHAYDRRPLEERGTYGKAFLQSTNLWRHDARIAGFTLARRFARVAARLLGVPAVRVYHDQALFKEPGGGITPWHQDQTYWPLATDRTITLWMPLVDVPEDVGSMHFVPGTSRAGALGLPGISGSTQRFFDALIAERGWQPHTFGAMRAGDATFHAGWTLHGAAANPTPLLREVMTVIYFAEGTRVVDEPSQVQAHDLRAWLPGCVPGGIAASEINPLLA